MFIAIVILVSAVLLYFLFHPRFGKRPSGARLALIEKSPQYKNGKFQNISFTPDLAEVHTFSEVLFEFFFKKVERKIPTDRIPSIKNNLLEIPVSEDIMVWFGHSSYYIQIEGKRFLIDPVFSGNASPIYGSTRAFEGTDIYTAADFPEIDYLLITHDHYDHLDYKTIMDLKPKIKKVICALGVGSHFEFWKFPIEDIIEKDWHEKIELDENLTLYTTPARHFSGRSINRCNTLWTSFVLEAKDFKMFLGGDSGYDTHYAEIGKKYGPFDIAIIENGQYNEKWNYIHNMPEDVVKAIQDINTKRALPVHSSKFALSLHAWDEPLIKVTELNNLSENPILLMTPLIGEIVELKNEEQQFRQWWIGIQ
ncbi:MBL fold metallo-hydrolase [Flavobacterium foetidum]|uniref:MBL fold metallo-hydrolase n=1 Tax=Flavobacterium foetidum TaxID=2026681 RepID=UPI0010755DEC|nr:MBL fold metallo-hydrolase [Flavobacterium foetidum]KAF2517028.1 MBL fold metallo-hydrolase [Flavobacterium foetidum]